MTMNSSLSTKPRVLVMGGGLPAQVVTQTLTAMGVDVTFARIPDTAMHVYGSQPGTESETTLANLGSGQHPVATLDMDRPPAIDSR